MDLGLLAALSDWLDPAWWWSVLQVVLGLGFVIFVHELGHFLAAKSCGVKCEKFYVGFDAFDIKIGDRVIVPRKLVAFKKGETEYGVGILPLGGYVKMLGQDDNPSKMAEERERAMMEKGDGVDGTALDPRSYIAKTVPQRMLIISAGVIMNLIFAVVFACIAFGFGVNYEPPKVGRTVPGSPAWQASLDGSTVNEISGYRTDKPDYYFNFGHLKELIVLDSDDGPLQLEIVRPDAEEPTRESISAVAELIGIKGGGNLKSLGIYPMLGTKMSAFPTVDGQAASKAKPPIMEGDEFLKFDNLELKSGFEMTRYLAQNSNKEVRILAKRADGTEVEILMPPNPMRLFDFQMMFGPVQALRNSSPAAAAGMLVGDTLVSIDGQNIGNIFTLQNRMLAKARTGESVEIVVARKKPDGNQPENVTLNVKPQLPGSNSLTHDKLGISIESLGINLIVYNVVEKVGQPQEGGVRAGDKVLSTQIILNERQAALEENSRLTMVTKFDSDETKNRWPLIHEAAQRLDDGSRVSLQVERNGVVKTVEARVRISDKYFQDTRGFTPLLEQQFYKDVSAWAAIKNGFRQTVDDASRVLKFLRKLTKGELSLTNFGGPGTIVTVATSEASQGTSRLLLFLTLLSANLAIINFLPIPVLDGGHMVFLAYEGIFRRPVNENIQVALTLVGFGLLLLLMITVIGMDIWRAIG